MNREKSPGHTPSKKRGGKYIYVLYLGEDPPGLPVMGREKNVRTTGLPYVGDRPESMVFSSGSSDHPPRGHEVEGNEPDDFWLERCLLLFLAKVRHVEGVREKKVAA